MPGRKRMKQLPRLTSTSPKSGRKAPGTRYGILQDWREGSNSSGKTSIRSEKRFRDGC